MAEFWLGPFCLRFKKGPLKLLDERLYIVFFDAKFSSHDVLNKLVFCVMQCFSLC
jgi:hypothetical protein